MRPSLIVYEVVTGAALTSVGVLMAWLLGWSILGAVTAGIAGNLCAIAFRKPI